MAISALVRELDNAGVFAPESKNTVELVRVAFIVSGVVFALLATTSILSLNVAVALPCIALTYLSYEAVAFTSNILKRKQILGVLPLVPSTSALTKNAPLLALIEKLSK